MRIIKTVYPCQECENEIDPLHKFCPKCGAEQSDVNDMVVYNVFYRQKGAEVFNRMFGGSPVLTMEDAEGLIADLGLPDDFESFLCGYIPNKQDESNNFEIVTVHWFAIKEGRMSTDEGVKTVTFTHLE